MGGNLGDSGNHYHLTRTKKSSSDCAEDQPFLINSVHLCLIVMNTILTVIHALKPNSLTHSLQIYCTGFTGPKSHRSWGWTTKRVHTIILINNLICIISTYLYYSDINLLNYVLN